MAQQLMDDRLKSDWSKLRAKVRENWDKLTDQDINQIDGNYEVLIERLKVRYGYSDNEAERVFERWIVEAPSPSNRVQSGSGRSEESRRHESRNEESTLGKWLLGILIPLLAIAGYYLWNQEETANRAVAPSGETITIIAPVDSQIIDNIRSAFQANPRLGEIFRNLQYQSNNGVVTISGTIPSQQEKEQVLLLIRNLPGVNQVVDQVQIQ